MTKKPHKPAQLRRTPRRGPDIPQPTSLGQGFPATTIGRATVEKAAAAQVDAMRATLWAHNYGLDLLKLRSMTLEDFARHISRNTAWGAIEIPSYVMATLAVTRTERPPFSKGRVDATKRCDMCGAPWEYVDEPPRPVVYHAEDCPHAGSTGRNRTQGHHGRAAYIIDEPKL